VTRSVRVGLESDIEWRQAIDRARRNAVDLVCLPHLSFTAYPANSRDRGGLELAERAPSPTLAEAVAAAGGAWVAASAYESEGEGVFYATAYLARPGQAVPSSRQRALDARAGRYEPMFFSPGHTPPTPVRLPGGVAVHLVGADIRDPTRWAEAVGAGATWIIGGTSDMTEAWSQTCRIASGLAGAHRVTVLVVNRGDAEFAGGHAAFGPDGYLGISDDGCYDL
jgi:predicted amidohydrolase